MLLKNKKMPQETHHALTNTLMDGSYSSVVKTLITLAKDPGSILVPIQRLMAIHNSSFSRSDTLLWLSSQQEYMCHTYMHQSKIFIHIKENK